MTKATIPGKSKPVYSNQLIDGVKHFTWGEATKGLTRIPTSWKVTARIIELAKELDKLKETKFGGKPVVITSWFRDPVSNRRVGGVSNSEHLLGNAADIQVIGISPREVQRLLKDWKGGLGSYSTFTHLDLGVRRRWKG